MTQETKWTGLKFEPHGLYGQRIDGEAMPFGYISEPGYGKPIFELSPIFAHPAEDLRTLALQMAAAPEMAKALKAVLPLLPIGFAPTGRPGGADERNAALAAVRAAIEAALQKAGI
jgi:hypothetical protein